MRHHTGAKLDCQLRSCMWLIEFLLCERPSLGMHVGCQIPKIALPVSSPPLLWTLLVILVLFSSHGVTMEACLKCVTHHRILNYT